MLGFFYIYNKKMARAKKKPKPMKSRKSGLKTAKLLKSNYEILKKYGN